MKKYAEMSDEQAKATVDECLRHSLSECMRRRDEGRVKTEKIQLTMWSEIGIEKDVVGLFFTPPDNFGYLPEGEFRIKIMANSPSGRVIIWEILSGELLVT